MDQNQTLLFFTQLKNEPEVSDRLGKSSFKDFVRNMKFDDFVFDSLERKFQTITANLLP
jgi:hypothetical protein